MTKLNKYKSRENIILVFSLLGIISIYKHWNKYAFYLLETKKQFTRLETKILHIISQREAENIRRHAF